MIFGTSTPPDLKYVNQTQHKPTNKFLIKKIFLEKKTKKKQKKMPYVENIEQISVSLKTNYDKFYYL